MTAIAGLRGTGDWGADQRPKSFRETILFRNPNGSAPMTALMSRIRSESTDDPEFSWWDEPNDINRLQVNGSLTSSDTVIEVDSDDPDETNPGRVYGKATHLKPGDILMVEQSTEPSDWSSIEMVAVTEVISETKFKVTRGAAGTSASSISDDAWLTKIGSAYGEGTPSPKATTRNPQKYYNYCQIFKTTYELTETAKGTKTRTGDPLKNDKKRKMFDHSRDLEMSFLFGVRHETVDTNGKPLRYTGGLRYFLPSDNVKIKTDSDYSKAYDLLEDVYHLWDFDTEAGDERICFVGNGALNVLNKIAQNSGEVQYTGDIKQWGMNFQTLKLPQGTLYFKSHPLMNRHSMYQNSMFIIDPTALRYRHFRDTASQDRIEGNDEDTHKGQWLSEVGLEVLHGGLTCGYLGDVSTDL